ncbi:MAG TPA: hypothetical protein VF832_18780, partial [Longimicrobiales bacterium]
MKPILACAMMALTGCAACSTSPTTGGSTPPPIDSSSAGGDSVALWLTTADGSRLLSPQRGPRFDVPAPAPAYIIDVDTT